MAAVNAWAASGCKLEAPEEVAEAETLAAAEAAAAADAHAAALCRRLAQRVALNTVSLILPWLDPNPGALTQKALALSQPQNPSPNPNPITTPNPNFNPNQITLLAVLEMIVFIIVVNDLEASRLHPPRPLTSPPPPAHLPPTSPHLFLTSSPPPPYYTSLLPTSYFHP